MTRVLLLALFCLAVTGVEARELDLREAEVRPPFGMRVGGDGPVFKAETPSDFDAHVEALYKGLERYSASTTPVTFRLSNVRTFPLDQVQSLPMRDFATLPHGWLLRMGRDRHRHGGGSDRDSSIAYLYNWKQVPAPLGDSWERLTQSRSLGSVLQEVALELREFQFVEYVSMYDVEVSGLGRSRAYRATIFWARTMETGRWHPLPHDKIVEGIDWFVDETGRARTVEEAAFIEANIENPLDFLEVAPNGTTQSATATCDSGSTPFQLDRAKNSTYHHVVGSNGGHISGIKGKFFCHCSTDCTSQCAFQLETIVCTDVGSLVDSKYQHDMRYETDSTFQIVQRALTAGAQCGAGIACGMRECINGMCGDVTVSIGAIGFKITTTIEGATWNGSLTGEMVCAPCELASSDPCLTASVNPNGPDSVDPCAEPQPGDDDAPCNCGTPIVISLTDQQFDLTSIEEGVSFDIDADWRPERVSWTAPDSDEAFLALDRNGNGVIDGGWELFGDVTSQEDFEEPNGYQALRWYDLKRNSGNEDAVISADDAVFEDLLLWRDANHDGVSQPEELRTLAEAGIVALALDPVVSNRRDRHGNRLRWQSKVLFEDGRWRPAAADAVLRIE